MKSLEEILQEYFGCKGDAFNKDGRFSDEGICAYDKLERLIYYLSCLGIGIDYDKVITELDKIEYENH